MVIFYYCYNIKLFEKSFNINVLNAKATGDSPLLSRILYFTWNYEKLHSGQSVLNLPCIGYYSIVRPEGGAGGVESGTVVVAPSPPPMVTG